MFCVWKYSINQLPPHPCIKHFHSISVCLDVSRHPLPLLHLFLPFSSARPSFPHPCWHSAVKSSCRWVQLWSQSIGGHIQEALTYMCDFLVKLRISPPSKNCHKLYPLLVWWLAGIYIYIYFFTINFSSSTSITFHHWCPGDYKQLGRDKLQNRTQGAEGRSERIGKKRKTRTEGATYSFSSGSPAVCFSISVLYMCHL